MKNSSNLYPTVYDLTYLNNATDLFIEDYVNILNTSKLIALFLDENLKILRFTPLLTKHFNVGKKDVGVPVADFIKRNEDSINNSFIEDCKLAIQKNKVIEREINEVDGNFFRRKISPYITSNKKNLV